MRLSNRLYHAFNLTWSEAERDGQQIASHEGAMTKLEGELTAKGIKSGEGASDVEEKACRLFMLVAHSKSWDFNVKQQVKHSSP